MEEDGAEEGALQQAAWEVYGVAPSDFVTTRTRWVKELRSRKQREAAKSVAALRKPSVSAAAINALVRAQDQAADHLRDVGTRMRHAQSALDAEGLAALRGERDEVLRNWVAAAGTHASGPLTAAVESEVRDTAVAALADGAAAEVVMSGMLTRALSYSGFGEVDVSDAVARTSTGVVLTRIEGGGESVAPEREDDEIEDLEDQAGAPEPDEDDEAEGLEDQAGGPEPDEDSASAPETDEDESDGLQGPALAQLETSLAQAEQQVKATRRARRAALEEMETAVARAEEAEEAMTQARELLARAEKAANAARTAKDEARAALTAADTALAEARTSRDDARTALEEAEDAD